MAAPKPPVGGPVAAFLLHKRRTEPMSTLVKLQADGPGTPLPHFWEECVGSGHASLALRTDWQEQIAIAHDELGMKRVRFHGIFDDDMSVAYELWGKAHIGFHNVDIIFDHLVAIGMEPFIEMSFMPSCMASGTQTIFHYRGNVTPPKDQGQWRDLCEAFGRHLVRRYGEKRVRGWNFEVWNEPNLGGFWAGTQEQYFELYRSAAEGLRAADRELKIGGPATARDAWVADLIKFCRDNSLPLDFVTTHHYPTDQALMWEEKAHEKLGYGQRDVIAAWTRDVRKQCGKLPLHYTEWNSSPSPRDDNHDISFGAAFALHTILGNAGVVDSYSYWTFSDIFEELGFSSVPFHGGFGLMTIHGVRKPAWQAFRWLHEAGDRLVQPQIVGDSETVGAYCTRGEHLDVFAYNFGMPGKDVAEEPVAIEITGAASARARLGRIEAGRTDPRGAWAEMGHPDDLWPEQVAELHEAAKVEEEAAEGKAARGGLRFEFALPPNCLWRLRLPAR